MQIEIQSRGRRVLFQDLITRWLINALGLVLVSRWVKGINVTGTLGEQALTVLAASAILGLVNAALRPALLILTLPITLLTLGLFTLVINGALLWMVSLLVRGFSIEGLWPAVLGSLLLSLISMVLTTVLKAGGMSVRIHR
jgi:putative membrane protein